MLNEQSEKALPMDPVIEKEISDAITSVHDVDAEVDFHNSHIKIMDNPLFMMQPN